MNVTTLVEQINQAASDYAVAGLQQFRAKLHKKRPRTFSIFSAQTTFATNGKNYAFHDGGRTELQFNVGMEEDGKHRFWRHGVAFSFERSQTLPDPILLWPKKTRFNEWVRTSGLLLNAFKMWHWLGKGENSKRSEDRLPGEISDELLKAEAFVFLGTRVPEVKVDVKQILQDFDVLYPLYQFVESERPMKGPSAKLPEEIEKGSLYEEGNVEKILVNRYERDSHARDQCIRHYGTTCVLCKFDFVAKYGPVMEGFIHVHHVKQLSKLGAGYKLDPTRDLRPVCPNCHAVLHRKEPAYSLEEVRHFLQMQHGS